MDLSSRVFLGYAAINQVFHLFAVTICHRPIVHIRLHSVLNPALVQRLLPPAPELRLRPHPLHNRRSPPGGPGNRNAATARPAVREYIMPLYAERPPLPSDDKRWRIVNGTMRKHGFSRIALIETLHTVQSSFGFLDDARD